MLTTKAKYYDIKNKSWKEIEVKIDKKLNFDYSNSSWFAIDGEFLGLYPGRDKDVLWTIGSEDDNGNLRVEMIYTYEGDADISGLDELLQSDKEKMFFYGQIDLAFLYKLTGKKVAQPIFDVKVCSKVVRSYTGEHNIDGMVKSFAGTMEDIFPKREMGKFKEFGFSPETWDEQLHQYNVNDVAYLKFLSEKIKEMAKRIDKEEAMNAVNAALPELAVLYAKGYYRDVFSFTYNDTDMASGTVIPRGR